MINVRVCCGLSVGIYTPGHLHRSAVTPRYAVACHAGSHLVCMRYNPGWHPDMLWSVGFHMIYSRVTPRVWPAMRNHIWFVHDIIQGHTQICCGLSVCTWFTLGHTQWCCDLAVSTWFTPGSHPDMLCSVGLHMIYSRVTPRYAVVCRFAHDLLWVTPSDAVIWRFPHDLLQDHTQICCALSVCTWFTPGSHPDILWSVGFHMIYSGSHPVMLWFAQDIIQGHTQICYILRFGVTPGLRMI